MSDVCVCCPVCQDGATPLFKACHKGHAEVVEELLKYNPNLAVLKVVLMCEKCGYLIF